MSEASGRKEKIVPQRLKGFRDHLPVGMSVRQYVMDTLRGVFELHGFGALETPAIEYSATLEGKYGEDERLMYRFEDQGKRKVGLRFDLTVPLARVVGMHQNELQFPWKRYQISPVWRGENPQFGRYREFYQCDIDIVGTSSPVADAETLAIYGEVMEKLGFKEYRVVINHRAVLAGMARSAGVAPDKAGTIFRAVDKLDKIGPDGVREEMIKNGVEEEVAIRALEMYMRGAKVASFADNKALLAELAGVLASDEEASKGLKELGEILSVLEGMDVQLDRFRLDVTLARGLDYYTGAVFEIVVDEPKIGSLGGGGRYDNLVGMFAGRDLPTVGGSFGVERIIDVMTTLGMVTPRATPSKALIAVFDRSSESLHDSMQLASELRKQGIACEVYINVGDKLGKQFGYADKLGIPFVLIVGPDERAGGMVTVKRLRTADDRRPTTNDRPNQEAVERGRVAELLLEG